MIRILSAGLLFLCAVLGLSGVAERLFPSLGVRTMTAERSEVGGGNALGCHKAKERS